VSRAYGTAAAFTTRAATTAAGRIPPPQTKQRQPVGATPAAPAPLQYAPPTNEQFLQIRQRLMQPYIVPSAAKKSTGAAGAVSTECSVLALDVGDRYVGVAVSERRLPAALSGLAGGGWVGSALPRRAELLPSLQRKELVASGAVLPTSPHSHHRVNTRKHTDLRGAAPSARRSLKPRSADALATELRALLQEHRSVAIVVGMPLTLAHTLDEQCTKTLAFVEQMQHALAKLGASSPASRPRTGSSLPLPAFQPPAWCFWDERLTSVEARQQLSSAGVRAHSRAMAEQTDSMAAAVILQEFLERMHLVAQWQQQQQQQQQRPPPSAGQ